MFFIYVTLDERSCRECSCFIRDRGYGSRRIRGGAGRAVEGVGIAVAEAGFPEAVQVAVRVDFAAVAGFRIEIF